MHFLDVRQTSRREFSLMLKHALLDHALALSICTKLLTVRRAVGLHLLALRLTGFAFGELLLNVLLAGCRELICIFDQALPNFLPALLALTRIDVATRLDPRKGDDERTSPGIVGA